MSRSSFSTAVALLALALGVGSAPASAEAPARSRRVVLLEPPSALERALRTALMPWGMRVARSQERARPRPPRSPGEARTLARRLRADALVWLAPSLRRHELWLYDGSNGTLTTRSVPPPPFDETRAAALALSVKTELRKGTLADATPAVAGEFAAKTVPPAGKEAPIEPAASGSVASEPELERARSTLAAPEPAAPEPAPAAPAKRPSRPALRKAARVAVAEPALPEPLPPEPFVLEASAELDAPSFDSAPWTPSDTPRWKLIVLAAARRGATTLGGTEGRYAVEGRWAPWVSPEDRASLWLSARFDMGLARPVETAAFSGEYSELGGGLGAGASLRFSRWLEVGLQVATALRAAAISGSFSDATPAEQDRLGLDLHVRPALELSLGSTLGVLVEPGLGLAVVRQRYEADAVEVLETSAVWWQLGAGLRVALD